ncbi:response regulator transcription factor [Paenibacillus koleovorans]|uniref:response regulator transcription factor n=1 Tax=Paenibacillus koleovorans TaxID=121608 RepID=UPI000FD96E06|nr:helix-turn-helix domain-containing protein [Paenibacillus koleovorans]
MKICVVEDEKSTRESIIHKLSLLSSDNLIFDVEYGFKALERLLLIQPNLVFIDIYMPELNGLEMLRQVRGKLPHTRFVILTGYGEFEYAREALLLGVEDYLLKPVYDKDLKKIVEKVQTDLLSEMKLNLQQELRLLEQSGYNIEIKSIDYPEIWSDENLRKKIRMGKDQSDSKDKVMIQFQTYRGMKGIVVLVDSTESETDCFYDCQQFINQLRKEIDLYTASCFFDETRDLAVIRMKQSHRSGLSSAIMLRNAMVSHLASGKSDLVEFHRLFDQWTSYIGEISLKLLQRECVMLLGSLDGAFQNSNMRFIEETDKAYWEDWVHSSEKWSELRNRMDYLVRKGLSALYSLADSNKLTDREIVDRIQAMIANFSDYQHMSLDRFAEQFHIHPVVLSKVFKKQTGINFIQYLTKNKMLRASYLLQHTSMKVHEVSAEVGYSNYRYFSMLFKKEFHVLPQQYRRNERSTYADEQE